MEQQSNNVLRDEIRKITHDDTPASEISATDKLLELHKDVIVKFWRWFKRSEWSGYKKSDNDEVKTIEQIAEYFINNIYKK